MTGSWASRSWPEHRTEVLGIDLGLNNLLSTSEGDVRGIRFLDQLRRYDEQLMSLQRGLQGAGIRGLSECRRYRSFVAKLQGWLKTTIPRELKALLDMRRPKKVVIEDLLFAGQPGALSRRMNRLLRRFGQRYFSQTLTERQAEFGFELVTVDPAYTSQTCHRCGFVHRDNRRGNSFKCQACGHLAHADVNAAKNLVRRSDERAGAKAVTSAPGALLSERGTSGLLASHRAVGSTRAGLQALVTKKGSALKLSPEMRKQMMPAYSSPTLEGLLNGLKVGAA